MGVFTGFYCQIIDKQDSNTKNNEKNPAPKFFENCGRETSYQFSLA
jgi:hypothetical protein